MNLFSSRAVHPLHARFWFRVRTLMNFLMCIVMCAGIVAVLSFIIPFWAADIIAIGAMMYWFIIFLNKRPIKVRCPHCFKNLLSNTPWVCGFCGEKNEKADEFSFIYQCEHCSAEPKAYKCHHAACGQLVHLSDDGLDENFAYCLNTRFVIDSARRQILRTDELKEKDHALTLAEREAKIDELTRRRIRENDRLERKQVLDDQIEIEGLEAKLATIRRQRESVVPKSIRDQKQDSLNRSYDAALAAREIAEKKRTEARAFYKDDPEGLKDALDAIDKWLSDNY